MKLYNIIKKSINFWNMSERASDKLLFNVIWTIFSYIMERTSYIKLDDNDIHFVIDQQLSLIFVVLVHWNNSLFSRHVVSLRHIIPIPI